MSHHYCKNCLADNVELDEICPKCFRVNSADSVWLTYFYLASLAFMACLLLKVAGRAIW